MCQPESHHDDREPSKLRNARHFAERKKSDQQREWRDQRGIEHCAASAEQKAFSSACHGAGRALSRHAALKRWSGRKIVDDLAAQGIIIRSPSSRGVAEEAPGAYKDVSAVVAVAERAGLARRVARLRPLVCIKG